jgi:hypothetical protein
METVPEQEKYTSSELEQVLDTLSTEQIRFVVARQEFSTDKEAAEAIGIKPNTVYQWKNKGALVDDAVRLMALDGVVVASRVRRRNLAKAMMVKVAGLDSKDERMRQSTATEIIEWEMGKATQKQELTGAEGKPIEVDIGIDDSSIAEALAILGKTNNCPGCRG